MTSMWTEEFVARMLDEGLPLQYIQRTMRELTEHIDESITEESLRALNTDISVQMGAPEVLVPALAQAYRQRSFYSRHPWFAFGLLPIGFAVLTLLVFMCCSVLVTIPLIYFVTGRAIEQMFFTPPTATEVTILKVVHYATQFLPPIIAVYAFWLISSAWGYPRHWSMLAVSVLAVTFGFFTFDLKFLDGSPTGETVSYEIGLFQIDRMSKHVAAQLIQGCFTFAIGTALLWIEHRQRSDVQALFGSSTP